MIKDKITKIMGSFLESCDIKEIITIQSGLINTTYRINTSNEHYILQKLNQTVFQNSKALLHNKIKICHFLQKIDFPTITYLPSKEGYFYIKEDSEIWQLSKYIPSVVKDRMDSTEVALKAGYHLALFHKALLDFPINELEYTIPDFHNTLKRHSDFLEYVSRANDKRATIAKIEIEKINLFFPKIEKAAIAIQKRIIPLRVVHNDTKISNMLFDSFGNIICLIDYDTIMPGSILHDIGDALRSGTNTSTEEEINLTNVNFDSNLYNAFMKGYIDEAISFMTNDEIENIHLSLPLLLFEQACRFLGDYLNNDQYYTIYYEQQNLVRAKTQIHLLEQVCIYFKL